MVQPLWRQKGAADDNGEKWSRSRTVDCREVERERELSVRKTARESSDRLTVTWVIA
jgi:hypothetical protein